VTLQEAAGGGADGASATLANTTAHPLAHSAKLARAKPYAASSASMPRTGACRRVRRLLWPSIGTLQPCLAGEARHACKLTNRGGITAWVWRMHKLFAYDKAASDLVRCVATKGAVQPTGAEGSLYER
jgi:hypothetical protein